MAEEELQIIRLRNDFYRDGFRDVAFALGVIVTAVVLLIATSLYLFFVKPVPVNFATDPEWRILPPVSVDQTYLSPANLLQWVSESMSTLFDFDFLNYANKLKEYQQYFTDNGWKKYNDILSTYVPANAIQTGRSVVTGSAYGAPVIINQGMLSGRYAWRVQMPVNINFSGYNKIYSQAFVFELIVVRVPTLNNLSGVAIDNLTVISQRQINTGY